MNLKIKIEPVSWTKTTKPSSGHAMLNNLHFGCTNNISWGYWDESNNAVGFHYQKINRKVKTSKRVKKEWNGQTVWTTKRTYEPKKWIVSYYKIPLPVLNFLGVNLQQTGNHFKLVKRK